MPAVQKNPVHLIDDFHRNKFVGGGKNEGLTESKEFPKKDWVSAIALAEEFPHANLTRDDMRMIADILLGQNSEAHDMRMEGEDGVEFYHPDLADMIRQYVGEKYGEGLERETEGAMQAEKRERPVQDFDEKLSGRIQ